MRENMVLDSATMVERNRKEGMRIESGLFHDSVSAQTLGAAVNNERYNDAVIVSAGSGRWENSKGFDTIWKNIYLLSQKISNGKKDPTYANSSQFPADYYDLINYLRIDVSRRLADFADYTGVLTAETVRMDMSQKVGLNEFKPFAGAFEEITGRGDSVNMIEHTTGSEAVKYVKLYGLGDVRSLEDELYNLDIYTMQKINDAFARAYVAKRNDLCLGRLFTKADGSTARTWGTGQSVSADTTGTTYDEKVYKTVLAMYKALIALNDYQTGLKINASRVIVIASTVDAFAINRVINGQIDTYKGIPTNLSALGMVQNILPYNGDSIVANKKTYSYTGCTTGTIFMCVPGSMNGPAYTMTKRGLTYETGAGNPLVLARESKVAYFGQCNYLDEFFGGSADTALTTGTGYIVKGTMPS